jgi:hypothetical protein
MADSWGLCDACGWKIAILPALFSLSGNDPGPAQFPSPSLACGGRGQARASGVAQLVRALACHAEKTSIKSTPHYSAAVAPDLTIHARSHQKSASHPFRGVGWPRPCSSAGTKIGLCHGRIICRFFVLSLDDSQVFPLVYRVFPLVYEEGHGPAFQIGIDGRRRFRQVVSRSSSPP